MELIVGSNFDKIQSKSKLKCVDKVKKGQIKLESNLFLQARSKVTSENDENLTQNTKDESRPKKLQVRTPQIHLSSNNILHLANDFL